MNVRQFRAPVIASAVFALIALCLAITLVNQHLEASRSSAEIDQLTSTLSRLSHLDAADRTVTRTFSEMSLKFGGRYKDVSWGVQMPTMINQLNGLMQAHKIKMDSLRPEPITSGDGVSRLPLRITFKAQLGDLARVVQDVEKTVPVLCIEQLDVRMSDEKSLLLQADMIVSSFAVTDPNAPEPELLKAEHPSAKPALVKSPTWTATQASYHGKGGKPLKPGRGTL